MKKIVLISGLFILSIFHLVAQPQMQPLPIDPKVKYGKLDNGLTYYIRHNELPKERADFFIAQNVGSVLEEDNQSGLAHFLEHMAFNGTKNFPDKGLINYLETIGVKFGENLNAYTSFDNTVYNISDVPTIREGIIDSCILILHDWSGFLTLSDEEINKERGVIREEMRTYGGAAFRQMEKLFPQILPENQYAKRFPIGTENVIMNFKSDELRDYYHKWYRPDLQAIIIVGDIDIDHVESKIKSIFADIPKPVNPAERIYYHVEDNDTPLVGIVADKEATRTMISVDYKHDPLSNEQKASALGLLMQYFQQVTSNMINTRISEIIQKANPPFVNAAAYNNDFANTATKEAWTSVSIAEENQVEKALKAITIEIQRVKKFGFTPTEYERAKTDILKGYESAFKEKDKTPNISYATEYAEHFTKGGYIPGIEIEYNMVNSVAPQIPVEAVNEYFTKMVGDKNIVISLTCPEKEGLIIPAKEQLIAWFDEARNENIEPYKDNINDEPLMKNLPQGGSVKEEYHDNIFNTINYTLSNGVKIIIKPTVFKDDEILMSATSPGGSSHFPESDPVNIKLYNSVSNLGGLSSFSNTDLNKILAGKKVSVQPTMSLTAEGFGGSSSPQDFETMLQLTYLHFTMPRMDEEAYQSFIGRYKSQLESFEVAPQTALIDTFTKAVYNNYLRNSRLKAEDLKDVNYQTIMNWRKDRFKDASDFTFIFTGNINPDSCMNLITQYLGALPATNRNESFIPVNMDINAGVIKKQFDKQMEDPKATIINLYSGTLEPNLANRTKIDILQQLLDIIYTEKVRENEGGTYGVSVNGGISDYPKGQTVLQISFETDPSKKDYLNEIVHNELKAIVSDGFKMEDFLKVKEFMQKKQQEMEQENGYWNSIITNYYKTSYNGYSDYISTLNSIQPEDIKEIVQLLLDQNNLVEVIMSGVK